LLEIWRIFFFFSLYGRIDYTKNSCNKKGEKNRPPSGKKLSVGILIPDRNLIMLAGIKTVVQFRKILAGIINLTELMPENDVDLVFRSRLLLLILRLLLQSFSCQRKLKLIKKVYNPSPLELIKFSARKRYLELLTCIF
jgi:hypothetical protein